MIEDIDIELGRRPEWDDRHTDGPMSLDEWSHRFLPIIARQVAHSVHHMLKTTEIFKNDPLYHELYARLQNEMDDIKNALRQRVIEILFQRRVTDVDEVKLDATVLYELHAWIMHYSSTYKKLRYYLSDNMGMDQGYLSDPSYSAYDMSTPSGMDRDERAVLAHELSIQTKQQEYQTLSRRFDAKKFELMRDANSRLLRVSEDMRSIAALYEANAVPTSTFEDLEAEQYQKVQARMSRGGMVHLFDPSRSDIRIVQNIVRGNADLKNYKTPKQQLLENMTGRNGMAGRYETLGMFENGTDRLLAWISYRLPPRKPVVSESEHPEIWTEYRHRLEKYARQVIHFFEKKAQMDRDCDMQEIIEHAATTMEIDTINASVPGAGTPIVDRLLAAVHAQYPEMTHIYLVRYSNMRIVGRKPRDMPNDASGDFFRIRGFVSEGHVFDKDEVAWRQTQHGFVVVRPKWIVMCAEFADARAASHKEWEKLCAIHERSESARRFGEVLDMLPNAAAEEPQPHPFTEWINRESRQEVPSSVGLRPISGAQ
ncbi:MAG TPA: hypothetical protein VHA78_02305 [Candidatus Peribacteraceae bacterium]|nr:hypothetical protein [Candidatus Peribacteraceae bacterium]